MLQQGETDRAREELERGPELSIFNSRDHGGLLQITGQPRKAVQYDIGNPLTATKMTQHQLPASLYAPLRVVLYENEAGWATAVPRSLGSSVTTASPQSHAHSMPVSRAC